eukprot:5651719-Ditylum_brightwellii.AAC.1
MHHRPRNLLSAWSPMPTLPPPKRKIPQHFYITHHSKWKNGRSLQKKWEREQEEAEKQISQVIDKLNEATEQA